MYKLTNNNSVIRTSDNAHIPFADGNSDYAAYQQWLLEGNVVLPADVVVIPYTALRAAEYPSINEYLDGIIKGDIAQQQKYITDCLAVKAKYPKV